MDCVCFLLAGKPSLHSVHPEPSELFVNSCSLPNYDRMSAPDKIFLGWRETQAEGTTRGRKGKGNPSLSRINTHIHFNLGTAKKTK